MSHIIGSFECPTAGQPSHPFVRVADYSLAIHKHYAVDSYRCNTRWARIATGRCPGLLGPPPSQIPQPAHREDHGEAS
jgi:hypothetical protein